MEFNESMPCAPATQKTLYYDKPTQVKFLDFLEFENDKPCWIGGIAYHNEVICGCCGGVFKIYELYEKAEEHKYEDSPIEVLSWIDISEAIK